MAEAETPGVRHSDVALKHRVSLSALKYHVYKARRGERGTAPRLLPVRIGAEPPVLQAQVGTIRVSFSESCSPAYVAALLGALGKTVC